MRPLSSSAEAQVNLNPGFERTLGCGLVRVLPPGGPTLARSRLRLGIPAASSCHVGPESTCHIMCQCQRPGWAGSRPGPGDCSNLGSGPAPLAVPSGRPAAPVWGDARLPAGGSPAGPRDSGQGTAPAAGGGAATRTRSRKDPGPDPGSAEPGAPRPTSLLGRVRDARLVRRPAGPARPGARVPMRPQRSWVGIVHRPAGGPCGCRRTATS